MELRVQSVLDGHPLDRVRLSLESIAAAARIATDQGLLDRVVVSYGDSGPAPWSDTDFGDLSADLPWPVEVTRIRFEECPGYSRTHNLLAADGTEDLLLLVHPDTVLAPTALAVLVGELGRPEVGIVDAKQIPLEHPKNFDPVTGATSWVSGVCLLLRRGLFDEVGRFDAESFPSTGADVDLSWRVRERGLLAVTQSAATAFHDDRVPSSTPTYSDRARLMLAHKWSRPDEVDALLSLWSGEDTDERRATAAEFRRRKAAGTLPSQHDTDHLVGHFEGGDYAVLRYRLPGGIDDAH